MNTIVKVSLRESTDKDLMLVYKWRCNPLIYNGLYTQHIENRQLELAEHIKWWYTHSLWKKFIITVDNNKIGWLNINFMDGYWSPEIGIGIGETNYCRKGYAKKALLLGLKYLINRGYKYTHTTILDDNIVSIRLFESVGYVRGPESRPGECWYYMKL